jgi:hypothetical protein
MDDFQPKLIYLARRHPALDREGFRARWREHARLGMSRPRWTNIARYVHCDIVEPPPALRDRLGDQDGVGIIWHRSPRHRAAHIADTRSRGEMEADEAATFSRPIVEDCLVAREEMMIEPQAGATWKLIAFLESARPLPCPATAVGHVRNLALPPEKGRAWGLESGLVEEFWFESRDAAEQAALALGGPRRELVLAREVQLFLRP